MTKIKSRFKKISYNFRFKRRNTGREHSQIKRESFHSSGAATGRNLAPFFSRYSFTACPYRSLNLTLRKSGLLISVIFKDDPF